jgi:hypothetical protein
VKGDAVQLWVGNYAFPANACACTMARRVSALSDSGRPLRYVQTFGVQGTLFGAGQAVLAALENGLRAQLAIEYQDIVLKTDAGLASGLFIPSRQSLSGVRILDGPNFMESRGSEYVTTRKFSFTAEAEFMQAGTETALVSFQETMSVTGNGGPVRRWRIPVNAKMIRQTVSPYSVIRYQHAGTAVGHFGQPIPPEPFFGRDLLVNEQENKATEHPKPLGNSFVNWPVRWNYAGESDVYMRPVHTLPKF